MDSQESLSIAPNILLTELMPTNKTTILPDTVWRLFEGAHPSHRLLQSHLLEDLFLWSRFELGFTLIGAEAASADNLPLSARAVHGLHTFMDLYPEWVKGEPYMSIAQTLRRDRIDTLFGDSPLILEPSGNEIPPKLYELLIKEKKRGGAALVRGTNADLILLKLPHRLPNTVLFDLLIPYLNAWRKSVPSGKEIKISGKGGRSAQLRHELIMLGRFRLFRANAFNIGRTLEAAYGADSRDRGDSFYSARTFMNHLVLNRWAITETVLCSV